MVTNLSADGLSLGTRRNKFPVQEFKVRKKAPTVQSDVHSEGNSVNEVLCSAVA